MAHLIAPSILSGDFANLITDIEMLHLLSGKNVTELTNPHLESIYEVSFLEICSSTDAQLPKALSLIV